MAARRGRSEDSIYYDHTAPGTWRDFRHADRFLAAGEEAMEQALSGLRALARPGP